MKDAPTRTVAEVRDYRRRQNELHRSVAYRAWLRDHQERLFQAYRDAPPRAPARTCEDLADSDS